MAQHLIGRTLAGLAVVASVAIVAGAGADSATPESARVTPTMPKWATRPCVTEDSVNCRWDADTAGNGAGHSYIVRQFPGAARMVCVMYAQPSYARTHDYCTATR